jgi:hypothetical protein
VSDDTPSDADRAQRHGDHDTTQSGAAVHPTILSTAVRSIQRVRIQRVGAHDVVCRLMGRPLHHLLAAAACALSFALFAGCGPEASQTSVVAPVTSTPQTMSPTPQDAGGPTPSSSAAADAGPSALVKKVLVSEKRADCVGESARKCMQVRESESDPWTLFYDRIEGFTYEEGHRYELRVALESNPNPPADGSSLRYRLVEVISKQKVAPPSKSR